MKDNKPAEYLFSTGIAMLLLYACGMLVSGLLFFLGTPLSGLHLYLAFFVSFLIGLFLFGWPLKTTIAAFSSCAALLAVACLVSSRFIDLSWDGQCYHGETILQLAGGWNPFTGPPISDHLTDKAHRLSVWTNYYPKGGWINSSILLLVTGTLEGAKSWNLFLAAAAAMVVLSFLIKVSGRTSLPVFTIALLAVLNPVVICQSMSAYVDVLVYLFFLSLLCCLGHYMLGKDRPASLVGIGSCIVAMSNIKLTGLFFALAVCMLFCFIVLWKKGFAECLRMGLYFMVFFTVAVLVVGYNPYITSLIERHDPFYVMMVPRIYSTVHEQVDRNFILGNGLYKLLYALFSTSANVFYIAPPLKTPLTFNLDELAVFKDADVRFGGFGPMFGGALLVSIAVYFAVSEAAHRLKKEGVPEWNEARFWMAGAAIAIISTTLAIGEGWWARYAAQMWLLPVVPLAAMLCLPRGPGRFGKIAAILLVQILLINVIVVGEIYFSHQWKFTNLAREQQALLAGKSLKEKVPIYFSPDFRVTAKYRLLSAKIKFSEVPDLKSCANPEDLVGSWAHVKVCKPK